MSAEEKFIVKVQLPLYSNRPNPKALVYNEDRSVMLEVVITHQVGLVMGSLYKRFMWAHMDGSNLWIGDEAPWQEW